MKQVVVSTKLPVLCPQFLNLITKAAVLDLKIGIFILGVSVAFSEVIDLIHKVLNSGHSIAIVAALVLKLFLKISVLFIKPPIHELKVIALILKVLVIISKVLVGVSKALDVDLKTSILSL
jgi:hypothetical protein